MKPSISHRARLVVALSAATVLTGCALAPGHYLNVTPNPDTPEGASIESYTSQADIYAINPTTVAQQIELRRTMEDMAKSNRKPPSRPSKASYQYLVGPQDILQITVWNHPELSNPTATANELSGRVVNADGYFFYPYVGKIKASGRTASQIRDELARKLANYLVDPQVDVTVMSYRSQRAFAVGELENPGAVPITDVPLTITELIAKAGGLKQQADLRGATLTDASGVTRPIDLYALFYEGDVSQDVLLKHGDVLNVPENRYNKVFVLGEVGKPQSLVMPRGRISLSEALADAGGLNPLTANAGHVYVIRAAENKKPQIWYLNAADPTALVLADSFDLQPRDVIYVDPAPVTRWSRVINSILPSANFFYRVAQ